MSSLPARLTAVDFYPPYEGCKGVIDPIAGSRSLASAAQELERRLEDGAVCPCCRQHAQVYARTLNSGMVRCLIWVCREYAESGGWVDTGKSPPHVMRSREWGKLVYWGMLTPKANTDPAKSASGLWKPTKRGIEFAQGMTTVPKKAYLYNGEVLGFSREMTDVKKALGKKFDYRELMGLAT